MRTSLMLCGACVRHQKQPCAARIKDLMSFCNGLTFTVQVMLRIASASAFTTTKRTTRSLAKECVTRQKSKTRPGNHSRPNHYSRPDQGETSLRTIREQRHATILRTIHLLRAFCCCFSRSQAELHSP